MDNFVDGMQDTFGNAGTLRTFLRAKLGRNLDTYIAETMKFPEVCAAIDAAAEREGWYSDLVGKARDEFPLRLDFRSLCDEILKSPRGSPATQPKRDLDRERRRRLTNYVLIVVILVALCIWLSRWLGWTGLITAAVSGASVIPVALKWWLDNAKNARNVSGKIDDRMSRQSTTTALLGILIAGWAASLFFGFVRVVSLPNQVTAVRIQRVAASDPLPPLPQGGVRVVRVWPWGSSFEIDADGYVPQKASLCPWSRLHVKDGDFVARHYVLIKADPRLSALLPRGPEEKKARIVLKHAEKAVHEGDYVGQPLLIGCGTQSYVPSVSGPAPERVQPDLTLGQDDKLTVDLFDSAGTELFRDLLYTVPQPAGSPQVIEWLLPAKSP